MEIYQTAMLTLTGAKCHWCTAPGVKQVSLLDSEGRIEKEVYACEDHPGPDAFEREVVEQGRLL